MEPTNPGFSATHCKWILREQTIVGFSATIAHGFSKHQRILDSLLLITNGLSKKWTNHGLFAAYCKWILLKKQSIMDFLLLSANGFSRNQHMSMVLCRRCSNVFCVCSTLEKMYQPKGSSSWKAMAHPIIDSWSYALSSLSWEYSSSYVFQMWCHWWCKTGFWQNFTTQYLFLDIYHHSLFWV